MEAGVNSPTYVEWGKSTDIPVPGDYDGDGKTDRAVWRPSDRTLYVINENRVKIKTVAMGETTDIPVPGDYDGDRKTDWALWRPSNGKWYMESGVNSPSYVAWGKSTDIPVSNHFIRIDGDLKAVI